MVLARNDDDLLIADLIHQAMLVSDAARPQPFEVAFERFRFANSAKGVWAVSMIRRRNRSNNFFIDGSPIVVLLEGRLVKGNDPH